MICQQQKLGVGKGSSTFFTCMPAYTAMCNVSIDRIRRIDSARQVRLRNPKLALPPRVCRFRLVMLEEFRRLRICMFRNTRWSAVCSQGAQVAPSFELVRAASHDGSMQAVLNKSQQRSTDHRLYLQEEALATLDDCAVFKHSAQTLPDACADRSVKCLLSKTSGIVQVRVTVAHSSLDHLANL